ncbi:hypothetical protein HHI36_001706 [Cryptolaemus montrouzieri]|uniref:Glucosylceramidase n=1 Tax=Cryptolaemus montrouzieri TaxID=559131 RepID=A0ABD2P8R3_9CUCU
MGSNYNLCRVPMGGTDFSIRGYSYDDVTDDVNLDNFKLAPEDFEYKIPLMKIALNLSMYQTQLKFFTSTWTAPKWMKINNEYYGLRGELKTEYYQTWADYFLKFLKAYKEQGFEFWAITPGNEPLLARIPHVKINSVAWNAETASLFVRNI